MNFQMAKFTSIVLLGFAWFISILFKIFFNQDRDTRNIDEK